MKFYISAFENVTLVLKSLLFTKISEVITFKQNAKVKINQEAYLV